MALKTDPYLENKIINGGPTNPTSLPNPVAGIYIAPKVTGYVDPGLTGVAPVAQYGGAPAQPKQPGLTGAYFPGATPVPYTPTNIPSTPTAVNTKPKTVSAPTGGSDAVRQLQLQLNQQNAGKPGWVPLNPDGIMGPKTLAAQSFGTTVPGSAGAIAQQTGYTYTPNPADVANQAEIDRLMQEQRNAANQTIDPNQVYQDNLNTYQAQIDSLDNIYNDMLVQSRTNNAPTYARRLGAGASLAVNQGLTGSNVGNSNISQIEEANNQEQLAAEAVINDQRRVALAKIYGDVRAATNDDLKAKRDAKAKGADALLDYLKGAGERRSAKVSTAVKALLAQGIDPSKMSPEELKSITEGTGATKDELTAAYNEGKATKDAAAKKAEQDAMKALPAAAQEYEYAKTNGYKGSFSQYQNEDANRKARSAGGSKLSIGEQHAGVVSNLSQLFTPGATIPNSGGVPFIDGEVGRATAEGWKTAMSAAQADGLPRKDFIIQFGYLIAPGLESRYGITPAEIKLINGALPEAQ